MSDIQPFDFEGTQARTLTDDVPGNPNKAIVNVPFHGDTIDAIQTGTGSWVVSLRRMCENLGVDYAGQYTKLKAKKWAVIGISSITGADGKTYEMTTIDRRTLTMWLAGINPGKVRPELRAKIEAYQCEAADALDEYFSQGAAIREQPGDSDDDLIARALLAATRKIRERDQKVRQQQLRLDAQRPKVLFADAVETSHTSILVGDLAKILKGNGMDVGANRLFAWLRDNGYLIRRKGTDWNMPTQKAMELGLFEVKETAITHADGHVSVNKTPKVTGKGQTYFVNRLIGANHETA